MIRIGWRKLMRGARRIHFWRYAFLTAIVLFVFGFFFLLGIINTLPSPQLLADHEVTESTKIYDRTGTTVLYEIYGEEKRTVLPFEKIPTQVKQATIAIEDAEFYNHPAIDLKSLFRAVFVNLRHGWGTQGGSTITQQLAKNVFLSREKTITRKIKELVLAFRLEQKFTKDEILSLYLNQIPYGGTAYGIESASQTYFKKSVADLTLPEIAVLVALPQSPSYYSPWGGHVKELMDRKTLVLSKMRDLGYITTEQYESANKAKITFTQQTSGILAPHFVIAVQDYLNAKYGEDFVRSAGLKVITTLDWNLQQRAEEAVKVGAQRNEELYQGKNAALVAQDTKTGQILALVGSRDYFNKDIDGQFNVVMQGLRQPGSAIKPFAYLAALVKGLTPDTILFDVPTEFDTTKNPENSYQPGNFDDDFVGPITLRNALAQSRNIPAVKTLYLAGVDNFLKLVKSFGISTLTERGRYGLSLVLGGGEVKLIDLIDAYSVLSQEGIKHNQAIVLRVEDRKGQVLEEYRDISSRVIDAQYPRMINNILSSVEARSPLFHASLNQTIFPGYDVAIKTGTTNDYRDAWSIGYTPNLAVGVWAGNSNNQPMVRSGGSILAAIPILHAFLSDALIGQPQDRFTIPDPLTPTKPVLRGEHITTYQLGGISYPQVHSILYYIDKRNPNGPVPTAPDRDPQFENWEKPVIEWAKTHITGFIEGVTYNQPIPFGATLSSTSQMASSSITFTTPTNGSFVNTSLTVTANLSSINPITRIDILLNGTILESRTGSFGNNYSYQNTFTVNNLNQQNSLILSFFDTANIETKQEIIVYK
jgi:1A family penicillin-binding protein